jgi:hypothetical protein
MLVGRRSGVLAREGGEESGSRIRLARKVLKKAAFKLSEKFGFPGGCLVGCSLTGRSLEARDAVADCKGGRATSLLEQRCDVDGRFDGEEGGRGGGYVVDRRRLRLWRTRRRKVKVFRKSQMMVPAHDLRKGHTLGGGGGPPIGMAVTTDH